MITKYNDFLLEWTINDNTDFFAQIKSAIQLHSRTYVNIMNFEKVNQKSMKIYDRFNTEAFKKWFFGSIVNNKDGSPQLVHHSSYEKFNKFNTPAFFGSNGTSNAYGGEHYYYCVLQIKNPLELRRNVLGTEKWIELLKDILKDLPDVQNRLDFAEKYWDSYGLFKILQGSFGEPYKWPEVFKYIEKNGYDGAIYRESDQSIQWYFDSYIVMKPEQIKIVYIQSHEEEY